ncbi:MAG: alanine dehydrogenase, partial [Actinomycetes bacterium]
MHDLFAAADLIVCAALVPGARAPVVVTDSDVSRMAPGSVLVDVAIDQGGNYELAHPTTHGEPTYDSHGVLVSCITNLPAAVPRTSTFALGSAISEYVIALADKGWKDACAQDPALALGINVSGGRVVHPALLP